MTYYLITNTYFNDRDKERFGVDFFLNKGIKVKVIDVQDYTNPELYKSVKPLYKNENNLDVSVCANFYDFQNAISFNEDSFAILFLSFIIELQLNAKSSRVLILYTPTISSYQALPKTKDGVPLITLSHPIVPEIVTVAIALSIKMKGSDSTLTNLTRLEFFKILL